MLVTLLGMTMLVKPVQFWNAQPKMLVTLLPIVTLVKPVQPLNAQVSIEVTVVLGNTIDTIRCIPSGITEVVTPVMKAPFDELLVLADRSRFTSLPAVCNAASNCVQPLSAVPISPKSISMGRGTGSVVCAPRYWTKVRGRVSVWLALWEHTLVSPTFVSEVMVGVVSAQLPQLWASGFIGAN